MRERESDQGSPQRFLGWYKFHGLSFRISGVFREEERKIEERMGSKKDISSRPLSTGDVVFKNKLISLYLRGLQVTCFS